jgi:hypothetical protein
MADDKQKYNRNLTTTHGDRTTETTHEPKVTTKTKQSVNGFYNPDGTPNAAAQQEFEAQRRATAAAYGIDPETGRVQRRYISDILGIDPEVMRKQRQQEEELNRAKQKESALYNSLAVLGDMITTAGGGNVWQRNADQHAKEAHANNLALEREQQAEDIANNTKLRTTEQAYAAAVQKLRDSVGTAFGTKISNTVEQGGKTTAKTTQGKDTTTGYIEGRTGKGSGNGNGSGSNGGSIKTVKIQVKDTNGNLATEDFHIPANDFDAMGRYLSAAYQNLTDSGKDNIDKVLAASGILPRDNGAGKNTYDGADLLSSGIVFDNPQIRAEFVKVIQADQTRTPEEKQNIIGIMQQYPTETAKKKSWWQRFKEWISGEEEDNGGFNPDSRDESITTEGGL